MMMLKDLLIHCQRNHYFLNILHHPVQIKTLNYGPLGTLLQSNILNAWSTNAYKQKSINIFPVSSSSGKTDRIHLDPSHTCSIGTHFKMSQYMSALAHFPAMLDIVGNQLPFGLAHVGREEMESSSTFPIQDLMLDSTNIWNLNEYTSLLVHIFCPPEDSSHWFEYWNQARFNWWKKCSTSPEKFTNSSMPEDRAVKKMIQFDFPWGRDTIESIHLNSPELIETIYTNSPQPAVQPTIVTSQTNLELATLVYLNDAFTMKKSFDFYMSVLNFHPSLAPYKVVVASLEDSDELRSIAQGLIHVLKLENLSVFPNCFIQPQYTRFDEMGIPFTFILEEDTIKKGLVKLRYGNSSIIETVTLDTALKYLQKYFKEPEN